MRKFLLMSLFLCISLMPMAQITITQINTPVAGYVAVERNDTVLTGVTAGNAGANQTWDFSGWVNNKETALGFVNPNTLDGYSHFPTSNIGIVDGSGRNQFANSNASEFNVLGFYADLMGTGSFVPVILNPGYKLVTFPSTYNTAFGYTYTALVQIPYSMPPVDSVRVEITGDITSLFDAWGTLTTPTYSNVSTIRQNFREIVTETTSLHMGGVWVPNGAPSVDTTYTITWWSDAHNYAVAEIEKDKTGTITDAKWLQSYLPGTLGVSAIADKINEVKIFPNPASDVLNITGVTEASVMVISDITGKVQTASILNKTNNRLDVTKLNNGIYLYQITDTKGKLTSNGKFVVAK